MKFTTNALAKGADFYKTKQFVVYFLNGYHVTTIVKKYLVILIIFNCVCLDAQHGYKSPYRAGIKLGYLIHTLTGDLTNSSPGEKFLGGFWFQLKMNKKWTAQTELLLLDKGIGIGPAGKSPHWVNLHYFEIPVLFQYHKNKTYVEFGPCLGYLINYAEHLYGNLSPNLVTTYPFIRNEFSFNVGIGCTLNEKWSLGLRLSHSLLPVRGAVPSVSEVSYNRFLALNLSRRLKKKKTGDPQA